MHAALTYIVRLNYIRSLEKRLEKAISHRMLPLFESPFNNSNLNPFFRYLSTLVGFILPIGS